MVSTDGMGQDGAAGSDPFDDDAIRFELRKMVESYRTEYLDKLAAVEVACRAEAEASEDQKQRLVSELEGAKSDGEQRYQMILDFIERR